MDTDITTLQELLTAQNRDDLAVLLTQATSRLDPSPTYGQNWHSYLATFVIEVPPDKYITLRHLPPEDCDLICETAKDLYPPQDGQCEIEKVVIHVRKVTNQDDMRRHRLQQLARSWLVRAEQLLQTTEHYYHNKRNADALHAAQASIEFSFKALCITTLNAYPKRHDLSDADCRELYRHAPPNLKSVLPRLMLYARFWRNIYTMTKYGDENILVGPEDLFCSEDITLALFHAHFCLETVQQNSLKRLGPTQVPAQDGHSDFPEHRPLPHADSELAPP